MSHVAQRRLGPISSAVISTVERFSPSWVSHERWSSLPVTTTRAPFWSDCATFSPIWPQQFTLKNDVCSSHWPLRWKRRFTASPKVAIACPEEVKRSSGSRVMLPTRVTELSGIEALLGSSGRGRCLAEQAAAGGLPVGQTDQLVADDVVREAQLAFEVVEGTGLHDDLEHDVGPFVLVVDLVREASPAPAVDRPDLAVLGLDRLGDAADRRLDRGVVGVAVDDDHEFVGSHERVVTSLWTRHIGAPPRAEQGLDWNSAA